MTNRFYLRAGLACLAIIGCLTVLKFIGITFAAVFLLLVAGLATMTIFRPRYWARIMRFLSSKWMFAVMALLAFPMVGLASSIGAIANPIIDHVQVELVSWIATGAMSAFWVVATWFGGLIGIRFVERMNRQTLQEAAERWINMKIDEIQARYLETSTPDLSDIIAGGIRYIKTGNPGTVKQAKATDDRLDAYLRAAISMGKQQSLGLISGEVVTG